MLKTQILSQFNVRLKSDVCLLFQGDMVKPSALGRRYLFIYFGGVDGFLFLFFYLIIYNELCSWICHSGLAEAGVIPSKLSNKNSSDNNSDNQGHIYFFPERYDMCSTFSNNFKIPISLNKKYLVQQVSLSTRFDSLESPVRV